MLVKTFEGLNIKEVVRNIKKEFGRDAVILETREKKLTNWRIGREKKMVEVTAAIPEAPRIAGARAAAQTHAHQSNLSDELLKYLQAEQQQLNQIQQGMLSKQQGQLLHEGLKEIKLLLLDGFRAKGSGDYKDMPSHLSPIYQQLLLAGVTKPYLLDLLKHLKALAPFDPQTMSAYESAADYYRGQAIGKMLKKLTIFPPLLPSSGQPFVHCFVGPSGAGKTSMVIKLAAYLQKQKTNGQTKILLISFEPLRIAAGESLRTYAKILDIPFVVLQHPQELPKVLTKYHDYNGILIDSAGRYPKQPHDLHDLLQLQALKEQDLPLDFHLVLSLTEKELQLDRAVSAFAPLGLASLLFTKLDESWTAGDIFNLSIKWSLPLSFFSIGSEIPHDLERASRERVMERIFGL